jgi:hypothetical protein
MRKHVPRWLQTTYAPIAPESSLPGSPFKLKGSTYEHIFEIEAELTYEVL